MKYMTHAPSDTHARTRTTWRSWSSALLFFFVVFTTSLSTAQVEPEPTTGEATTQQEATEQSPAYVAIQSELQSRHGYTQAWFDQPLAEKLVWQAALRAEIDAFPADMSSAREEILLLRGAQRILSQGIDQPRRKRDRVQRLVPLTQNIARQAQLQAEIEAVQGSRNVLQNEYELLSNYIKALDTYQDLLEKEAQDKRLAEEERRLEEERKRIEAANLKRKAEADLEKIKERQQLATTEQIKSLLTTQQSLAERVIEVTDETSRVEEELARLSEIDQKSFAQRRDEVSLFLEQLPPIATTLKPSTLASVDALFEKLRTQRRQRRQDFLDTRALLRELTAEYAIASARQIDDAQKLDEAIEAHKESQSELSEARQELATTRAKLSRLEASLLKFRLDQATAKYASLDQALTFYNTSIEELLARVSNQKRSNFYALGNEQNWRDARQGSQIALVRITAHAQEKLDLVLQVLSDPFSITLWSWVGGVVFRFLLVLAAIYLVTSRGPALIRRGLRALLKRPFFRKYPTLTLKLGEVVKSLLPVAARYAGWVYMLDYLRPLLPELEYVRWLITAIFIFRTVTVATSVLFLPRNARQRAAQEETRDPRPDAPQQPAWNPPRPGEDRAIDEETQEVDIFNLEYARAKKLVRSARVITIFWLLVIYIPAFVVVFLGHTVIWRIVDLAATWGFILVIYSVLSTWKDDIARLFERLASDRLPRAVQFVNENKDRVWGVLVIGLASIYVLGKESFRLGRRYLIETEWSKQINNFIFRKQIEYQQRDRDKFGAESTQEIPNPLPPEYTEFFEDRPLCDEVYIVDTAQQDTIDKMIAHYDGWNGHRNQGSIALHGEAGIGRSTALFELADTLQKRCAQHDQQIVYTRLIERCTSERDVLDFVASLFSLEAPESRQSLVAQINKLPTHVLLIDDCQRLFLRTIGGFAGLEAFLQIVNLTDGKHFWTLTFEHFAWNYLARIKQRTHYFGQVIAMRPWTDAEIQDLIWKRNLMTGRTTNFTNLVVTHEDANADVSFEVIKSARGYFRLLHDFSKGNPRIALLYWLRSIKISESDDNVMDVGLFRSPPQRPLTTLADNYWFTLTAISQHGALNSREIAQIINAEEGFCEMALNYFSEKNIVRLDGLDRAKLTPLYMRQIVKQLTISNYLYD